MSSGGHGGGIPLMHTAEHILHAVHDQGIHVQGKHLVIIFTVLIGLFFFVDPVQTAHNFELLLFLSPVWVPVALYEPMRSRGLELNRAKFFNKQNFVLLEIRMPRDTSKTPQAMETFFSNLHIGSGETTWLKRAQGSVRPWWSFEIVSIGGRVHFYIWTREGYRRLVETYLYAQYPEVEIIEAEDYSRLVDPASHDWEMWGGEYKKSKPDPYPIKTYLEYGLTPGAKPEESVDPIGALLEFMGSFGPGEQFWLQFVVRMSKDEKLGHKKTKDGKRYTWRDEATDIIEDLRQKNSMKGEYIDPVTGAIHETRVGQLTKGQQDVINAIEQNVTKQGFDVGIRAIYSAPKDKYVGITVPGMLNLFKPFNNEANNTLGIQGVWSALFNDWPWEDPSGHHQEHLNHELVRMYRQRMFFYPPYRGDWTIMSSQELATLYHVPSRGVTTPNLERIQSATTSAPSNLPQ